MPSFPKQAANSLVTETSQYFVFFCRSVCSAILAKCLIINVLRLIIVILFFIAFLNITYAARHSFATVLKRGGAKTSYISESLGHSNLSVTEHYLAYFEKEERIRNAQLLTNFNL
nr:tyrosine-type recombinase/integrase [Bacteroides ovatus]